MSWGTATTGFSSFTTSAAEKTAEAAKVARAAAQWEAAAKEAREGITNRRTT